MTRKAQISKRFSEAAKYYHDRAAVQRDIAEDTAKLLGNRSLEGRCIDLGCGTGFLAAQLARENPQLSVIGVDVALGMIELAETTFADLGNLSFVCADCTEALPNASVDFIVSSSSLQWMYPYQDTLRRWAGALAPRGKMVLSFMTPGTLAEIKTEREAVTKRKSPEHLPTLEQISALIKQAGLNPTTQASKLYRATYPTAAALLEDLRNLGVNAPLRDEPETKLTPEELGALKRGLEGNRDANSQIGLTYEVGFIVAEKPD